MAALRPGVPLPAPQAVPDAAAVPPPRAAPPPDPPAQAPDPPAQAPDTGHPRADTLAMDREAVLVRLFDLHYPRLLRLAVLLGADDAEDIVAEAFCQLHRRWNRLRTPHAALPYLRSVVCNLTRMRLRHLQVVRRNLDRRPEPVQSAESVVLLRDDQRALVEALRHLSARQREALVLRYWLGLGEGDIAASMGISPGAVKTHVARGMAALSKRMQERQ